MFCLSSNDSVKEALLKSGINFIGMTCTFTSIAKVIIYTHVNQVTAI